MLYNIERDGRHLAYKKAAVPTLNSISKTCREHFCSNRIGQLV